jgi:hypothetical protein
VQGDGEGRSGLGIRVTGDGVVDGHGQGQACGGAAADARGGGEVRGGAVRDRGAAERAGAREGGHGAVGRGGGRGDAVLGVHEGPVGAEAGAHEGVRGDFQGDQVPRRVQEFRVRAGGERAARVDPPSLRQLLRPPAGAPRRRERAGDDGAGAHARGLGRGQESPGRLRQERPEREDHAARRPQHHRRHHGGHWRQVHRPLHRPQDQADGESPGRSHLIQ